MSTNTTMKRSLHLPLMAIGVRMRFLDMGLDRLNQIMPSGCLPSGSRLQKSVGSYRLE